MIALDDVVLRDDLDPRLGERDDDLIAQYADIFDALPPIEINQHNEVIDGWHRVRAAEQANRTEIAYVVIETDGDDDLGDKMWQANVKHGVQYSQQQKRAFAERLKERGLSNPRIAEIVAVSARTIRRWYPSQQAKQPDKEAAQKLYEEGKTQQEIADELGVSQPTVNRWLIQNGQMSEMNKEAQPFEKPQPDATEPATKEPEPELTTDEVPAAEKAEKPGPESEPPPVESETDEAPQPEANESMDELESEPEPPPEPIPDDILKTARAVMGTFTETQPDDYVASLEASASERMTITDDSLSNELEREMLTSAAAMCLWQELMIWYQGENASTFTDAFGKIGPVFVRGQAGQWRIVSKLRSILRRLRA